MGVLGQKKPGTLRVGRSEAVAQGLLLVLLR